MTERKRTGRLADGQSKQQTLRFRLPNLPPKLVKRGLHGLIWVSLIAAVSLLAMAALSQLVLLIDPYHRAGEDVAALLESQPALERNLDTIDITSATLSEHLALFAAKGIDSAYSDVHDQRAIAAFAEKGIPSRDVVAFTSLMDSLADEILALSQALQQESLAVSLSPLLADVRSQHGSNSAMLDQLYMQIPAALEQVNALRLRLRTVANGAHIIFETPQFQPILAALEQVYNPPDALDEPALLYYALAAHSWSQLPPLCESLEIQFANEAIVLNELHSIIGQARQTAQRWGYTHAKSLALWLNNRIAFVILGSLVLLVISTVSLLGGRSLPLRRVKIDRSIRSSLSAIAGRLRALFHTIGEAGTQIKPRLESLIERLRTASQIPPTSAQPASAEAFLQIIRTGLPRAVKRLSRDRPLHIGSDPEDAVYIPSAPPGAVEVWIRSAKVGYFIEVLFSEAPVLLNDQPIAGARRLVHGDAIQILDTRLLFEEE